MTTTSADAMGAAPPPCDYRIFGAGEKRASANASLHAQSYGWVRRMLGLKGRKWVSVRGSLCDAMRSATGCGRILACWLRPARMAG